MHFVSCAAGGGEFNPIGLGELRLRHFRLETPPIAATGKPSAKPSPPALAQAERLEFAERFADQSRRRVQLPHPQLQIGVGDLDASAQQIRSRPPCGAAAHTASRISLRFPEKSVVVELQAIAQRRVVRRHETAETATAPLLMSWAIVSLSASPSRRSRPGHRPIAAAADWRLVTKATLIAASPRKPKRFETKCVTPPAPASLHATCKTRLQNRRSHRASHPAPRDAANVRLRDHRHIDRAIALFLGDLDLPHCAVLVVRTLQDRNRHADIGEVFRDIPVAEFRIEPGAVPAVEGVVDVLVPAREFRLQLRRSRRPVLIAAIEATEMSSTMNAARSAPRPHAMILTPPA